MNISSYSSVYNLGHKALEELFNGPVVIEEKIDGSQISWGLVGGQLFVRSKGKDQTSPLTDKLFEKAVHVIESLPLKEGYMYRGELLNKPKHNILSYGRVPKNYIIVFDIDRGDQDYLSPEEKREESNRIGLECVPVLTTGIFTTWESLKELLNTPSILGNVNIEGIIIKNYSVFGKDKKVLMGKFVSEAFKEIHNEDWKKRNPSSGDIIQEIILKYKTIPRWQKAVQHLRESGRLAEEPKDIGPLIQEVRADVYKECGDEIKDMLFKYAWPRIERAIVGDLADWYKEKLAKKQFEE